MQKRARGLGILPNQRSAFVNQTRKLQSILFGGTGLLLFLVVLRLLPLWITNGQSGWHRDELDMLDNARHLDWGFVSYPPLAPLLARLAWTLFGPSIPGVRLFSSLALAGTIILAARMAGGLGGGKSAQAIAAAAVLIAPIGMLAGVLYSYSSFDCLWWALIAYLMIRLLTTGNPRWWLAIGAVIGLGMMTKYTISYLVVGVVIGVLLTPARRQLRSPWLWAGVVLALLIVLPNLVWQVRHDFISWDFMQSIHARDVRNGRADGYLPEQLVFSANPVTIPLWAAGLVFFFLSPMGKRFRVLGWMYLVPFVLFFFSQGRSYYIAPAYPMLFAGGGVLFEEWLARLSAARGRLVRGVTGVAFTLGGLTFASIALPLAPVNSAWWNWASEINEELKEEIGWPELVATVAGIYDRLPPEQQARAGILTGNYGEAGALNLYGPAYGLPTAISGVNSYWLRGFGDPAPQTTIVLGYRASDVNLIFYSCELAGTNTNRYGVLNEESREHPDIWLCGAPRLPWAEMWTHLRGFG